MSGYEWDIGHFQGAQRPEVDCFRITSFGLSDLQVLTKIMQHVLHSWCTKGPAWYSLGKKLQLDTETVMCYFQAITK